MISEGSCDTEKWSNDAENPALLYRNKHEDVLFHMSLHWLSIWAISSATIEVFGFYNDLFGAHHSLSMKPVNRIHRF